MSSVAGEPKQGRIPLDNRIRYAESGQEERLWPAPIEPVQCGVQGDAAEVRGRLSQVHVRRDQGEWRRRLSYFD